MANHNRCRQSNKFIESKYTCQVQVNLCEQVPKNGFGFTSDNLVEIAVQDLLASHRVCSKAELKQSQITLTDELKTVLIIINKV